MHATSAPRVVETVAHSALISSVAYTHLTAVGVAEDGQYEVVGEQQTDVGHQAIHGEKHLLYAPVVLSPARHHLRKHACCLRTPAQRAFKSLVCWYAKGVSTTRSRQMLSPATPNRSPCVARHTVCPPTSPGLHAIAARCGGMLVMKYYDPRQT